MPLIAYRILPQRIVRNVSKTLAIPFHRKKYASPETAQTDLDTVLKSGHVAGLQVSVYWLPYFPEHYRFHFNAHNIIIYGKSGSTYKVSDPNLESPVTIEPADLEKVRFAKGYFAPKGFMYYPEQISEPIDYHSRLIPAIRKTARQMTHQEGPFRGIRGMRYMAGTVAKLPRKIEHSRKRRLFLGSIIRMQEEIGTGGGGFRFMYAS